MTHTSTNNVLSCRGRFPLSPKPTASVECLVGRLDCIARRLRKLGYSDHAALCGRDAALDEGMKALASGKAGRMSAGRRAGWLWILAKRAALRAAKKEMRCVPLTHDPPDYKRAEVDYQRPSAIAVQRAIERLPKQQRAAVMLCILLGLTRRQAAREMKIKASTLCWHLKAGLARLRKELAAFAPSPHSR